MNSDLQHLLRDLTHSLRGLDADQTQLCPPSRPDKWSIQQIVEHLLLTYSSTETVINTRLTKRTPTRSKPTLPQRIFCYAVTRRGYFPTGRPAPPLVTPQPTSHPLSGEHLAHAAVDYLDHLDLLFNEAETLFGPTSHCATHAVLGPLNITQWRRFHLIHGEHHIKQILAIRQAHHLPAISKPAPQQAAL